jgi:hypothetical protein
MSLPPVDAAHTGETTAKGFFSTTSEKLFQSNEDELAKSQKMRRKQRLRKKLPRLSLGQAPQARRANPEE